MWRLEEHTSVRKLWLVPYPCSTTTSPNILMSLWFYRGNVRPENREACRLIITRVSRQMSRIAPQVEDWVLLCVSFLHPFLFSDEYSNYFHRSRGSRRRVTIRGYRRDGTLAITVHHYGGRISVNRLEYWEYRRDQSRKRFPRHHVEAVCIFFFIRVRLTSPQI